MDTAAETRGRLTLVDLRLGFLLTNGETFTDRPFLHLGTGVQFGRAKAGGPPALALTLGLALGQGEIFAADASSSLRLLGGVELPWALGEGGSAGPLELVPVLQLGYQEAFGEDERSGFTLRAAVGLRVPAGSGTMHLTFEPVSFVLLPSSDVPGPDETSRVAFELGVMRVGWRF